MRHEVILPITNFFDRALNHWSALYAIPLSIKKHLPSADSTFSSVEISSNAAFTYF